jgi:hypothetical protein
MVKVLVNTTERIKQAASGPMIALPATIQPFFLYTWPDCTLRISSTFPTSRTVQLSDPMQNGEKEGILLELGNSLGFVLSIEPELDYSEFFVQCIDQVK